MAEEYPYSSTGLLSVEWELYRRNAYSEDGYSLDEIWVLYKAVIWIRKFLGQPDHKELTKQSN